MKIFQREPALWLAVVYAVLTVVGTFGLAHFTAEQAALANSAIAAIVGAVTAYFVRPIAPAAFTYAIAAIVNLLRVYGVVIPDDTLAAINALVIPALALVTRNQVSPVAPVTDKPTPEAAAKRAENAAG